MEQINLYDVGHFRHVKFSGFYQVGETVYNCDNPRKPIIKRGKAPHSLLDVYHLWFTVEQAENDLLAMGFRKVNQTLFEKGEWTNEGL